LTNSGTAIGSTSRTRQICRPARSVRSVSQAPAAPSSTLALVTTTTSDTVLLSSSATRGRNSSATSASYDELVACQSRKTSGSDASTATTAASATVSAPTGRPRPAAGRRR